VAHRQSALAVTYVCRLLWATLETVAISSGQPVHHQLPLVPAVTLRWLGAWATIKVVLWQSRQAPAVRRLVARFALRVVKARQLRAVQSVFQVSTQAQMVLVAPADCCLGKQATAQAALCF
jgi:hypothetical protein